MPVKRSKPSLAQCRAMTASGQQCKAKPYKDGLCFFHSDPRRAAELGRKGGRRKAAFIRSELKEIEAPKCAADLVRLLAQTIVEVRGGALDTRRANAISYLGTAFLRAVDVSDLEARVRALETRAEDVDAKSQTAT